MSDSGQGAPATDSENGSNGAGAGAATRPVKPAGQGKKTAKKPGPKANAKPPERPYPRVTLEDAIKVPYALKDKNGGNPWAPEDVANALGTKKGNASFFYTAAASIKFGLTEGGRDSKEIALAPLGKKLVYAGNPQEETDAKLEAFLSVDVFKRVVDYYQGNELPEMKYLGNTLKDKFGLHPDTHEEFAKLFRENCDYLGIGKGFSVKGGGAKKAPRIDPDDARRDTTIYAEPESGSNGLCFVIMPFSEKNPARPEGFFNEVLKNLIAPAGRAAGFTVATALRQGSDVIHATILKNLLSADLVVADLTDHNPSVLFELGVRISHNKPIALIRAKGTLPIFDVDNVLRVYDYSPHLWASTVEHDLPKITQHIQGSWDSRNDPETYMNLLLRAAGVLPAKA